MKRPALQRKRVGVLRMAFRARKFFGSFEKRTPGGVQMVLVTHAFTITDLKEIGKWGEHRILVIFVDLPNVVLLFAVRYKW